MNFEMKFPSAAEDEEKRKKAQTGRTEKCLPGSAPSALHLFF